MSGAAHERRTRWALIATALVLTAAIFLVDLHLPLGASVPSLYVAVVLLGLWSPARGFAAIAAVLASLLTMLGAVLSPIGATPWMAAVNRPAALMVIWLTALGVIRYKSAEKRLVEERKQARRAEALLASVVDSAPLTLLAVDRSGSITLAEGTGLRHMGFEPSQLLGGPGAEHFRDLAWLAQPLQRALSGEPSTTSGELRGCSYEVRATPLLDPSGHVVGGLAVSLDVTERQRAEASMRRQQTLARLGELAAVVAHEVRNPLAGIRATIQVLSKRLPEQDQSTVRALFERIDALNEMTEDLLLFAQPRPLQLEALPLKPLLRAAADLLTRDQRWSSIAVDVAGDEVCARADALVLRGVFLNLLLNAAEAMGGAGTIRVSILASDSTCRVSISDSGPGIPAELQERIFEPFFTTRHRGTGLGLAIVRRQVEQHGGEVSVSCPPGGGTTVAVTLALEPSAG